MGEEESGAGEVTKTTSDNEKENAKTIGPSGKLDAGSSATVPKTKTSVADKDASGVSKKKNIKVPKKETTDSPQNNNTPSTKSTALSKKDPDKTQKGKKIKESPKNENSGEADVDDIQKSNFVKEAFTKEMTDINEMVLEFLQWCGLQKVGQSLQQECEEQGLPVPALTPQAASRRGTPFRLESADGSPGVTMDQAVPLVLQLFDQCDGGRFFQLFQQVWNSQQGADDDLSLLTLQFHLHVYFATAPIRLGRQEDHAAAMAVFKQYVDSCPSQLGAVAELLPFYALPYVPQPHTHAAFAAVFQEPWLSCLRGRLQGWLRECLSPPPALVAVVRRAGRSSSSSASVACGASGAVAEARRSHRALKRKLRRLQDDYHRLLGVSLELTSALQQSVAGADVDLEATLAACTHRHPDLFTSALADSQASPATILLETLQRSGQQGVSSAPLSALDYATVSACLADGALLDCLLLLQALRQRVTLVTEGGARQAVVASYVRSDVLGIAQAQRSDEAAGSQLPLDRCWARLSLGLRSPESQLLGNSLARLLSALASFPLGRQYLGRSSSVCSLLLSVLLEDAVDASTQDFCLAALQKLSVRGDVQERLVAGGCVGWTVRALDEGVGTLSPSSQECCAALLLNLSLRSEGRAAVLPLMGKLIPTVTKLLAEKRPAVVSYVSGALYSLLSEPRFRHEALALRLDSSVARLAQSAEEEEYRQQLQYLVTQLLREDSPTPPVSPPPSPLHLQDVPDFLEDELELDDSVQAAPGQAAGERLLTRRYAARNSADEFLIMDVPGMSRSAPSLSSSDSQAPSTPQAGRPYSDSGPANATHLPQLQRGVQSAAPTQRWSVSAGSTRWRYPAKDDVPPNPRTSHRSDAWNSEDSPAASQHAIPQHVYSNDGSLQPVYFSSQQYPRYSSSQAPLRQIQVYKPPHHANISHSSPGGARYAQQTPPNTEAPVPIMEEEEEAEAAENDSSDRQAYRHNAHSEAVSAQPYSNPEAGNGRGQQGQLRTNSVQQSARRLQNRTQVPPLMLRQEEEWQSDPRYEDEAVDRSHYKRHQAQEETTPQEQNSEYVRREKQLLSHDYVEYDQQRPEEYYRSYDRSRVETREDEQRSRLEMDDPYKRARYNNEPIDQYSIEQREQHQREYFNRQREMGYEEEQEYARQRSHETSDARYYDSGDNEERDVRDPDDEQTYRTAGQTQSSRTTAVDQRSSKTYPDSNQNYDRRAQRDERHPSPPVAPASAQAAERNEDDGETDRPEGGRLRTAVQSMMQDKRAHSIENDPLLKSLPSNTAKEYIAIFSSRPRVMRTPPDSASGQRLSPTSWYADQPDSARRVLPPISRTNKSYTRSRI